MAKEWWGVFDWGGGEVDVVPCDERGDPLPTHEPGLGCECRPRLIHGSDGPLGLNGTIISHREPTHPGASDRLDA